MVGQFILLIALLMSPLAETAHAQFFGGRSTVQKLQQAQKKGNAEVSIQIEQVFERTNAEAKAKVAVEVIEFFKTAEGIGFLNNSSVGTYEKGISTAFNSLRNENVDVLSEQRLEFIRILADAWLQNEAISIDVARKFALLSNLVSLVETQRGQKLTTLSGFITRYTKFHKIYSKHSIQTVVNGLVRQAYKVIFSGQYQAAPGEVNGLSNLTETFGADEKTNELLTYGLGLTSVQDLQKLQEQFGVNGIAARLEAVFKNMSEFKGEASEAYTEIFLREYAKFLGSPQGEAFLNEVAAPEFKKINETINQLADKAMGFEESDKWQIKNLKVRIAAWSRNRSVGDLNGERARKLLRLVSELMNVDQTYRDLHLTDIFLETYVAKNYPKLTVKKFIGQVTEALGLKHNRRDIKLTAEEFKNISDLEGYAATHHVRVCNASLGNVKVP